MEGNPDVDYSIYTRELARLIRYANIDFNELPDGEFDSPLGESTGASVIFGTTGGVIEAACRTAYELYTKKNLDKVDFEELRGLEGIRSATIDFNGTPVKIDIAHGLGNARKLIEEVKNGTSPYHAIEVMACPGAVSAVVDNRSTEAVWRYFAGVLPLFTGKTLTNRFARAMRIRISSNYTASIWESLADRKPINYCIPIT